METKNIVSINELEVGDSGQVVSIKAQGGLKRRLLDMGLITGVKLQVKGKAPLGDPFQLNKSELIFYF